MRVRPVAAIFMAFRGPPGHGYSLTVGALKRKGSKNTYRYQARAAAAHVPRSLRLTLGPLRLDRTRSHAIHCDPILAFVQNREEGSTAPSEYLPKHTFRAFSDPSLRIAC